MKREFSLAAIGLATAVTLATAQNGSREPAPASAKDHVSSRFGQAEEYHFQGSNTYFVIATADTRAFLELRAYDHDDIIQSKVMYSPYKQPTYKVQDVAGDDTLEFLLQTRTGGTGCDQTYLTIVGLFDDAIQVLGEYLLEGRTETMTGERVETTKGKVTFPARNQLVYSRTCVVSEDGINTTNTVSDTYSFDAASKRFEKMTRANRATGGAK